LAISLTINNGYQKSQKAHAFSNLKFLIQIFGYICSQQGEEKKKKKKLGQFPKFSQTLVA
jgi:hypothetical protein